MNSFIQPLTATPCRRLVCMLGLSSAAGIVMLAIRMTYAGRLGYWSLPWDLFLAWIPIVLAFVVARLEEREKRPWLQIAAAAFAWLLFFPNAPYLITEFIHLHPAHGVYDGFIRSSLFDLSPRGSVPIWFDVLMLTTYAWTGLMLGFVSLFIMHRTAKRIAGEISGWIVVVIATGLCAFGVSLGRFERWNSWDLFSRPFSLLADVLDRMINPFAHPRTSAVTVLLAAFLLLGYLSLIALMRIGSAEGEIIGRQAS